MLRLGLFLYDDYKMTMMQLELIPVKEWGIFTETGRPLVIAGPCSAESEKQVLDTAHALKQMGVEVFRAGIWKPRTRPNCFEGVGAIGLDWLCRVREETGLKVAIEVANANHVALALEKNIDLLWLGARTTANPFAVQEIAETLKGHDVPVLVKNPIHPDIELWVGALERLNLAGLKKVGAVHRGFSSHMGSRYRNDPQWQLPIELKRRFKDLPIICDPSHIAGKQMYIHEIAQQAMNLGFDGLMIESHIRPFEALSDAEQQLTPEGLNTLLSGLLIRELESGNAVYRAHIDELREKINELDEALLQVLAHRMNITQEIGEYKRQNNIAILQPSRWNQVLAHAVEYAKLQGLDTEFVIRLFEIIHQASIDTQSDVKS